MVLSEVRGIEFAIAPFFRYFRSIGVICLDCLLLGLQHIPHSQWKLNNTIIVQLESGNWMITCYCPVEALCLWSAIIVYSLERTIFDMLHVRSLDFEFDRASSHSSGRYVRMGYTSMLPPPLRLRLASFDPCCS
ncbi:hypothetical protein N7G274_003505 [Stereocaulon virgatum]|uniref:Uncharacterized protein n=1 Tax=Stereocaulon virgatum TaxID=373712 RepID=A0ABR4ADY3_9LECA